MTTTETNVDLHWPTQDQLLDYITSDWMCVMYGENSLRWQVLIDFELSDSDKTRARLRAMLTELARKGLIVCDNLPWPANKGGYQSQCRRVA